jgi:hypothetical protein
LISILKKPSNTLDPHLIAVVKVDHIAQLRPTLLAWDDVFEFTVYPAVTAAEGLADQAHKPQNRAILQAVGCTVWGG